METAAKKPGKQWVRQTRKKPKVETVIDPLHPEYRIATTKGTKNQLIAFLIQVEEDGEEVWKARTRIRKGDGGLVCFLDRQPTSFKDRILIVAVRENAVIGTIV